MTEEIDRGTRKVRKEHQCYDCYRKIPAGTKCEYFTGKQDGSVYTLYFHSDCRAAGDHFRADAYWYDYEDGVPPLHDEITDSGEQDLILAQLRGRFPHVVCRMEFGDQIADQKYGEWWCPQ